MVIWRVAVGGLQMRRHGFAVEWLLGVGVGIVHHYGFGCWVAALSKGFGGDVVVGEGFS